MHRLFQTTLLFSPLWINTNGLTLAQPLHPKPSNACVDPSATFNTSCWRTLDIADFLTNTTTGWVSPTGYGNLCEPGDDTAHCCQKSETWPSCFIRQTIGLEDQNVQCGSVNSTSCPTNSTKIATAFAAPDQPMHRYVLHNIYTIFGLFQSWQDSLPGAIANAESNLRSQLTQLDPLQRVQVNQTSIFRSFLLGFPLLASAEAVNLITPPLHKLTNSSAQALLQGLQNAPAVTKALYPVSNDAQPVMLKLSDVQPYLVKLDTMAQLNASLERALKLVMSDLDTFVRFAGNGSFSGPEKLGVDGEDRALNVGLYSFVSSTVRKDRKYSRMVQGLDVGL